MKHTDPTQNQSRLTLSAREKYSAILLLCIGTLYLAVWIVSLLSETGSIVKLREGSVSIKAAELLNHLRSILTILFSLAGGLLLFRLRQTGWILANSIFVLFLGISSGGIYQGTKQDEPALIAFAVVCGIILLMAIVFLWLPTALRKFQVTKPIMLTTLAVTALLFSFFFLVQ